MNRSTIPFRARFPPVYNRFFTVRTLNPVRRVLNQGVLYILAIWSAILIGLIIHAVATLEVEWIIKDLAMVPVVALCWWLTLRGQVVGIGLLTIAIIMALSLNESIVWLDGSSVTIDVLSLVPIVFTALFIAPRTVFAAYGLEVVLIYGLSRYLQRNDDELRAIMFAVIVNLGVVTILLYIGASIFTRTLREWLALNTSLEQRVADRTAELGAANAYIEQRATARTDEVAKVVHDLRHFLTLVHVAVESTLLDAADAGIDSESLKHNEARANDGMLGLQALLDDMLDAAKLEGHVLKLRPQTINFSELVEKAANQLGPRFEAAECALTTIIPNNLPMVRCDPQRMLRVLHNIIGNAITYTSNARSDDAAVEIQLSDEGDMLVCRITDNGPGIAPKELVCLGERFARVAAGENAPDGSGLGLNFSIGIMHLTGGTLALESGGVEMGTTAVLRLPIASQHL